MSETCWKQQKTRERLRDLSVTFFDVISFRRQIYDNDKGDRQCMCSVEWNCSEVFDDTDSISTLQKLTRSLQTDACDTSLLIDVNNYVQDEKLMAALIANRQRQQQQLLRGRCARDFEISPQTRQTAQRKLSLQVLHTECITCRFVHILMHRSICGVLRAWH